MASMTDLLEHRLIVVTGKGGAGKTTVACALGMLAARRGLRTIVAEVGDQQRLPALFARSRGSEAGVAQPDRQTGEPAADVGRPDREARKPAAGIGAQPDRQTGEPAAGVEVELERNLWSTSIDPDAALLEWLRTVGGRISMRMLTASSTFQYFAAAAPGAKELVCMIKARALCEHHGDDGAGRDAIPGAPKGRGRDAQEGGTRGGDERGRYDLVVLDAPATGHALAMLRSPRTFAAIVRAGPLAAQAGKVGELLEDPRRSAYVAVAHATEMAVSETLELERGLRASLDRDLNAVVVNGVLARRFSKQELALIRRAAQTQARVRRGEGRTDVGAPSLEDPAPNGDAGLVDSAARTALTAYEGARMQRNQIARLRRRSFTGRVSPEVFTIPFAFVAELDPRMVGEIAERLRRRLTVGAS
jgi:anion-transporting  ArsA/GET3 family ATPase